MYQVLARKYRPKNFHELLGQSHVSTALINGIEQQRLHHAYLFTGTRGVGKTTIARILAKCLNCETGVTSEPCGMCSTCVAIDAGRFIDLIEIDAASRTKVEDTRELLDNVPYAPTQGRYKVYLIDEVHMLSTHSFNALLKTLEEPPAHVKFLLATTDPQKLPITIISRCLQFVLRPIPQVQLADYLAVILQKEQISFSSDALWQLASSARGSVRDALSLTDQAIAFGNGQIEPATVKSMLGLIDQADMVGLLLAIVQQQKPQVAQYIQQLREQVVDAKAVFDSLAEILHQVALLQVLPDFDLQLNREQTQARQRLAQTLPADLLQLYYEIVVQSRENIGLANTPLQALEMCILRLLAFRPLAVNEVALNPTAVSQADVLQIAQPILEDNTQTSIQENFIQKKTADDRLENLSNQQFPQENSGTSEKFSLDNSVHSLQENFENITQNNGENFAENTVQGNLREELADTIYQPSDNLALDNQASDLTVNPAADFSQPESLAENLANNDAEIVADNLPSSSNFLQNNDHNGAPPETIFLENPSDNISEDISPLALLEPVPQDLTGEWTPQKWDYWVYEARKHNWLAEDELVLAKRGVMTGEIAGESEFLTHKSILTDTRTFEDLCQKLVEHFPTMTVTLADPMLQTHINLASEVPESLQVSRDEQALALATQKIHQLPVMQALFAQNASLQNVTLNK